MGSVENHQQVLQMDSGEKRLNQLGYKHELRKEMDPKYFYDASNETAGGAQIMYNAYYGRFQTLYDHQRCPSSVCFIKGCKKY